MITFSNSIFVTSAFSARHQYPNAPDEVAYLRNDHRHLFHVRVEMQVDHDDRDLEFMIVKAELDKFLSDYEGMFLGSVSCEQMGQNIVIALDARWPRRVREVIVAEDGENGGIVRPHYTG